MTLQPQVWKFFDDTQSLETFETVEFKLIYHGQLKAATGKNTRVVEKHQIRKELHKQLKELWRVQPPLSRWGAEVVLAQNSPTGKNATVVEMLAHKYERWGYRFVPLISRKTWSAEIDILFLRRDQPGNLVGSGGDIDNRIKTLFDALRMPTDRTQVDHCSPEPDENPFFVLLEDDSQISKITVSTDRLLMPIADEESINDVHLIIGVKIKVLTPDRRLSDIEFL